MITLGTYSSHKSQSSVPWEDYLLHCLSRPPLPGLHCSLKALSTQLSFFFSFMDLTSLFPNKPLPFLIPSQYLHFRWPSVMPSEEWLYSFYPTWHIERCMQPYTSLCWTLTKFHQCLFTFVDKPQWESGGFPHCLTPGQGQLKAAHTFISWFSWFQFELCYYKSSCTAVMDLHSSNWNHVTKRKGTIPKVEEEHLLVHPKT